MAIGHRAIGLGCYHRPMALHERECFHEQPDTTPRNDQIRVDNVLVGSRCQRRFAIPSQQFIVFV